MWLSRLCVLLLMSTPAKLLLHLPPLECSCGTGGRSDCFACFALGCTPTFQQRPSCPGRLSPDPGSSDPPVHSLRLTGHGLALPRAQTPQAWCVLF
ncbi:hypothetical protein LEMLEM_LOCUS169 [Lemmus lemmus]